MSRAVYDPEIAGDSEDDIIAASFRLDTDGRAEVWCEPTWEDIAEGGKAKADWADGKESREWIVAHCTKIEIREE